MTPSPIFSEVLRLGFKRSSPGFISPLKTRKKENSPTCGSDSVLKTRADTGSETEIFLDVVSFEFGSTPSIFSRKSGEGVK